MRRIPCPSAILAIAAAVLVSSASAARAESKHVFGIHAWDWGADLTVMSQHTGWDVEPNLASDNPNVGGRIRPAVGEGFTIIQRLDYKWEETIPANPAMYPTFASQCATFAGKVKKYVRYYCIANEMDLQGFGPTPYAECFRQVRNAIKAVQPDAVVMLGHFTNEANFRTCMQILGPDGYDGVACHTSNHVPESLLNVLDAPDVNARPGVGVYITEWGWVAGTNPNAGSVMRTFYNAIGTWNATHTRQVYGACWYEYPCFLGPTFSLECSEIDRTAFAACTVLGTSVNSYASNPILITDPWVQIDASSTPSVRWTTNLPATSQVWYRLPPAHNGESTDLSTTLVTSHSLSLNGITAHTQYQIVPRSTGQNVADSDQPIRWFESGPWTINVEQPLWYVATISWTTGFAGASTIRYGTTSTLDQVVTVSTPTTDHVVTLDNLLPNKIYYFRAEATAANFLTHRSTVRSLVTGTGGPVTMASPTSFDLTTPERQSPPDSTLFISNPGSGTVNYTITDDADWLAVSPASGDVTDETDSIAVTIDVAGLTPGVWNATITIASPDALNGPVAVPVRLTVLNYYPAGDVNRDDDVDLEDFSFFQLCFNGANRPPVFPSCNVSDLDADGDVDLADFAVLLGCFNGPARPAPVSCPLVP